MRQQTRARLRLFLRDQLRQTSTRSGLWFLLATAGGYTLTDLQVERIMAAAGVLSALFALIFPDSRPPQPPNKA